MEFGNINSVGSIRLKVFEPCNWSCEFCHNEGDLLASPISWDNSLEDMLSQMREGCGTKEVHLTGGEPTLNPQTPTILKNIKRKGFIAKITTNGQFLPRVREEITTSGVDAVNFSLHSLDPDELVRVMSKKVDTVWATRQIERSKENIVTLAQNGIKVRVNCVLSGKADIKRVMDVFRFASNHGVEMRLLDNLNDRKSAGEGIAQLIQEFDGKQLSIEQEPGTSSKRLRYNFPGIGDMVIKQIERTFLESMCLSCPHFLNNTCQEGFYNIRVQKKDEKWVVILCIQNKNQETVMNLDDFLKKYGSK